MHAHTHREHEIQKVRTVEGDVLVGTDACLLPLIEALTDPEQRIRRLAVCGLAATHDPQAVEPLILATEDPSDEIRVAAAGPG